MFLKNLKNKKKSALVCTACISVFSTILAYGATYSVNTPEVSYESTSTTNTMNVDCSMNASTANYLRICVTPKYSSRGSTTYYNDTTKYISSGSSKAAAIAGTLAYTNMNGSHKTYMQIYQEGQVGTDSSGSAYATVDTKTTNIK